MRTKPINIVKSILPVLFLFGAYLYIGIIPVNYVYYPKISVYHEVVTWICIAECILAFFAIAIGVFRITNPKHLGLSFLLYQPVKFIVDLISLLYERKDLGYIFRASTFVTMFVYIGSTVVILKNKENNKPPHSGLGKFLIQCTPVTIICLLIPILENKFAPQIFNMLTSSTLGDMYGAEYIFNIVVLIMVVSTAIISVAFAIFAELSNATFDRGERLLSAKSLKLIGGSMLCSIISVIIWHLG